MYHLLFRASAAALRQWHLPQQLARDPRFVGGQIGMVGVLHTWARDLTYHPHVHYLVPGGGLAPDGQTWLPSRQDFLVHVRPLGRLFRAKFRAALQKTGLFDLVPAETWTKDWVVHCQPVGSGVAALKYLAPYILRVAISNNRILKVADDQVTFRYKDANTGKTRHCTVTAEEFIRRFLEQSPPWGSTCCPKALSRSGIIASSAPRIAACSTGSGNFLNNRPPRTPQTRLRPRQRPIRPHQTRLTVAPSVAG